MAPLWLSVELLTPLRLPWAGKPKPSDMGEAVAYFPLAGLLIGLVVLAACLATGRDLSMMHTGLWNVAVLALWTWFGSSLHLEGLADTLRGIASRQKGAKMLQVMREPALSAAGVAGIALALLAKYFWLDSMTPALYWALPFPMIISRCGQALACGFGRYAGSNQGAGRDYIRHADRVQSLVAVGWALAFVAVFSGLGAWKLGVTPVQIATALLACLLGSALGLLCLWRAMRRLNGVSGHLLGFASEICEIGTAYALVLLLTK